MQVIIQACNIIFESGRGADSSKKSHQAEKEGKIKKGYFTNPKIPTRGERGIPLTSILLFISLFPIPFLQGYRKVCVCVGGGVATPC